MSPRAAPFAPLLAAAGAGFVSLGAALPWLILPTDSVSGLALGGASLVYSATLALVVIAHGLRGGPGVTRILLGLSLLIAAQVGSSLGDALLLVLRPRAATSVPVELGPGLPVVLAATLGLAATAAHLNWPQGRSDRITERLFLVVAVASAAQALALIGELRARVTLGTADLWHMAILSAELVALAAVVAGITHVAAPRSWRERARRLLVSSLLVSTDR